MNGVRLAQKKMKKKPIEQMIFTAYYCHTEHFSNQHNKWILFRMSNFYL